MAGKFVSIEEAARLLGVSIDEVNRLVDRKKLFPMRDGGTVKFRVDDIERVAASLTDDSSRSESLTLDLDLPGSGASGAEPALDLGAAIDVGDLGLGSAADAGSQTIIRGGAAAPADVDGLSGLEIGDDDEDTAADSDDLVLESNIGASSPSLARPAFDSGTLGGSGAGGPAGLDAAGSRGSQATGSGGAGSGFAIPADSGLSLEDDGMGVASLDLDLGPVAGEAGGSLAGGSLGGGSLAGGSLAGGSLAGGSLGGGSLAGASLAGEAFELGGDVGDEDSASVVIATEESGDSSFFGNVADEAASVAFEDSSAALDSSSSSLAMGEQYLAPVETSFSGWQIAGLTCCALLLLAGAFVMFEVAWTIRTPQGMPASAPLLDALSATFGWRK